MVYDGARQRVVLFGGETGGQPTIYLNDTWAWDGTIWTQIADTGPSVRRTHAMAFDSIRERIVLLGGWVYQQTGTFLDETWEWDGEAWTQVADTGPSPRLGHTMAFDLARQRVVLFGGASLSAYFGDTWEWDGESWTQVADTGPSVRATHAMAYDADRKRVVLFGGQTVYPSTTFLNDTWEWDGATWIQVADTGPTPRVEAAMVAGKTGLVLFGGQIISNTRLGDTWEWDGEVWTNRQDMGPPERSSHAMAYDVDRDRVVLFGGWGSTPAAGDTWELAIIPQPEA